MSSSEESFDFEEYHHHHTCNSRSVTEKFKYSEHQEKHQLCLLFDGFNYMVDDFINLIFKKHKIDIWPRFTCGKINKSMRDCDIEEYDSCYKNLIQNKIESSKLIIAFVNNAFCDSDECMKLLQHCDKSKKPVIALIIEEIENEEKITTSGFSYRFDLYKERMTSTGYDQYLWISQPFNEMVVKIKEIIKFKPLYEHYDDEEYLDMYDDDDDDTFYYSEMFDSTDDDDNNNRRRRDQHDKPKRIYFVRSFYKYNHTIGNFFKRFQAVMSNGVVSNDMNDAIQHVDFKNLNITKLLPDDSILSSHYTYALKSLNIENISDYLKLVAHLDKSVQTGLKRVMSDRSDDKVSKKFANMRFKTIRNCIKEAYKSRNSTRDSNNTFDNDDNYILKYTYTFVRNEFKKLNIPLELVHQVVEFIGGIDLWTDEYEKLFDSDVIVVSLCKEFYDGQKLERLLNNFSLLQKPIFIAKLDEIEIDENIYRVLQENNLFRGEYNLFKHKAHDYDGHVLRNLFTNIKNENIPLEVESFVFNQYYDLFLCESMHNTKKEYLTVFENVFKEKNLSVCCKRELNGVKYDILDAIELSKVIIFFLENDYINSDDFKSEYEHAKHLKKDCLFVLMEEVKLNDENNQFDLDQLKVIHLYKTMNKESISNGEFYTRLGYLISLMHQQVSFEFKDNVSEWSKVQKDENDEEESKVIEQTKTRRIIDSFTLKKIGADYSFRGVELFFEVPEHNSFLAFNWKMVNTFKRDTMTLVTNEVMKKGENKDCYYDICFVKHINAYYLLHGKDLIRMGKERYIGPLSLKKFKEKIWHIAYNEANQLIYLHGIKSHQTYVTDCELEVTRYKRVIDYKKKSIKAMKIFNRCVYYLFDNCVLVYNDKLEFIAKFGDSVLSNAECILFPIDKNRLKNFLLITNQEGVYVFGVNHNNSFYEFISYPKETNTTSRESCRPTIKENFLVNDNLLQLTREDSGAKMLRINYVDCDAYKCNHLHDSFLCKMDSYRTHLLRNPFVLSCGNVACFECIYRNFTKYSSKFKCNFENCKNEHSLNDELKRSDVLESSLNDVCLNMIQYARSIPSRCLALAEKTNCFHSYFTMIEDNIEIRIESLKIAFDKLRDNCLEEVDNLHERLITKSKMQPSSAKRAKMIKDKETERIPRKIRKMIKKFRTKCVGINQVGTMGVLIVKCNEILYI